MENDAKLAAALLALRDAFVRAEVDRRDERWRLAYVDGWLRARAMVDTDEQADLMLERVFKAAASPDTGHGYDGELWATSFALAWEGLEDRGFK